MLEMYHDWLLKTVYGFKFFSNLMTPGISTVMFSMVGECFGLTGIISYVDWLEWLLSMTDCIWLSL